MPTPPKSQPTDHDALTLLLKDPIVRQATRALFKGDRERVELLLRDRVETLLRGMDRSLKMDEAMLVWLMAHAVESSKKDTDLNEKPTGDLKTFEEKEERSTQLLRLVGKSNAQIYQSMAKDMLRRYDDIDRRMQEPPGWQGWFIRNKRRLIRISAALTVITILLLLGLWWLSPPAPDPQLIALSTAAAIEAQATGTQAAILALTPTVTPSVTPLVANLTSGLNEGVALTILNCGYGDRLDVVQGSNLIATPIAGAGYSYFFIQYSATCRDALDNVCSVSGDLDFSLRLSNGSSVPDTGLRVAGESNPDFLANGQNGIGWMAFNIPKGAFPQSLLMASGNTSGGFSGTPTPTPVPVGMPLPCAVMDS